MAWLREWLRRLRDTVRPSRQDADLEAELRLHLELAVEEEHRRGQSGDAPRAAAIRTGGIAQSIEAMRDQRGVPWLHDLARDLRYAWRVSRRNPFFATIAILTLALGIGANTAIFSIADAVLFRPLPVHDARSLVILRQRGPSGDMFPFSLGAAEGLAESHDALSGLALFRPVPNTVVSVNGDAQFALTQSVSGNYHAVVGVRIVKGRGLVEADREPVAVISHRYWRQRFASDPNVVGRVLEVRRRAFTIVGVTAPEFFGTQPGRYVDVTTPLAAQTINMPPSARWLYVIGRLTPGTAREHALGTLRERWAQLAAAGSLPERPSPDKVTLELDPGAQGMNELRRDFSLPLRVLMVSVCLVLLVACANLAGLLFVRANARQQEMAVRLSLGAGRARIVRQLLTETALLAAAGGATGVALGHWGTNLLLAMMARGRGSIVIDVAPNARTLAFAAAVTIGTAALFGLLPALGASGPNVQRSLKLSAPGSGIARNLSGRALVAAQVALLVVLLTSAGLFMRTLQNLRSVDAGFRQDRVLVVALATGAAYPQDQTYQLYQELHARFARLPGVESVSMSMDTPPAGELSMCAAIQVPGRSLEGADAAVCRNFVGPAFFHTMGIPVLAGRDFEVSDDERAEQSVVIGESVARRFFGGADPIGRQILGGGLPGSRASATIIGVAKDVRYTSLRVDAPLMIYRPYRQESGAQANTFLIRTSSLSPEALMPMVRVEIRAAAPALPLPSIVTLEDRVAGVLVEERMLAALSSATALLAALLAAIGIYSTVAASVARRSREIGIRIALGARPGQVAWMTVSEATGIVATGLLIGVPAAIATALATRASLSGILFDLSTTDPITLAGSATAILVIASGAAYAPARRASRIDPVSALKNE